MIVTRFAPSPSGRLHLGHAFSAVARHMRGARASGGKFRLRIEDLDQTRCRPEFVDGSMKTCAGSACSGTSRCWSSRERTAAYQAALDDLQGARARLRLLLHPRGHRPVADRARTAMLRLPIPAPAASLPDDPERRVTTPHSWRLNSAKALADCRRLPSWTRGGRPRVHATRSRRSAMRSSPARMRRPPTTVLRRR